MKNYIHSHDGGQRKAEQPQPGSIVLAKCFGTRTRFRIAKTNKTAGEEVEVQTDGQEGDFDD